jgi:hypothetical protein
VRSVPTDAASDLSVLPPPACRRRLRVWHELSLRQVASELGVTPPTVHRWERDYMVPRKSNLQAYAALLCRLRHHAMTSGEDAHATTAADLFGTNEPP